MTDLTESTQPWSICCINQRAFITLHQIQRAFITLSQIPDLFDLLTLLHLDVLLLRPLACEFASTLTHTIPLGWSNNMFPIGTCLILSFLGSYGMFIPHMGLELVHLCVKLLKQWDTKSRWLPSRVARIPALFWGRFASLEMRFASEHDVLGIRSSGEQPK